MKNKKSFKNAVSANPLTHKLHPGVYGPIYYFLISFIFFSCAGAQFNLPGHAELKPGVSVINEYKYTLYNRESVNIENEQKKPEAIQSTAYYDKNGRLKREVIFSNKFGKVENNYTYNRNGFLKKINSLDSNGNILRKRTYAKLLSGRVKYKEIFNNNDKQVEKSTIYFFNTEGRIVKVFVPGENRLATYVFDEKGKVLSSSVFIQDTLYSKIDYAYGAEGMEYHTSYNNKNQILQKTSVKTDGDVSITTIYGSSDTANDSMIIRQRNYLDKKGNLIKSWIEENDSGIFTVMEYEISYK